MPPKPLLRCLLVVAAVSCGTPDDGLKPTGAECDTNLTYENFGRAFLEQYCTLCHASGRVGADRFGAPVNLNFDGPEFDGEVAILMDSAAADGPDASNRSMPPAGLPDQPSDEERRDLGAWLACGAP